MFCPTRWPYSSLVFIDVITMAVFFIRSFGKINNSIQMNSGPSKKWKRSKERQSDSESEWEGEREGEIITPFQIGHLIHLLLVIFFCYFEEKTDSSSWCLCYFYFFIWDHLDDHSDGLLQIHSRFLILISFDLVLLRC